MRKKIQKLDPFTIKFLMDKGILTEEQLQAALKVNTSENHTLTVGESIDAFTKLLSKNMSERTVEVYKKYAESFLINVNKVENLGEIEDSKIRNYRIEEIENWLSYLSSVGYDNSVFSQYKSGLSKFFKFLNDNGFNMPDVRLVELPQTELPEIIALREDEIIQIANNSPTLRGKAVITFMYETGIKRNELVDCKKSHIDFEKRTVDIYKGSKRERVGYMSKECTKLIEKHIEAWIEEVEEINEKRLTQAAIAKKIYKPVVVSEYLFQTYMSDRISYATIRKDINKAVYEYYFGKGLNENELSDMENRITSETLRHSRRVFYLSEGKTAQQVRALMGDENLARTYRYIPIAQKLYPEKFRDK